MAAANFFILILLCAIWMSAAGSTYKECAADQAGKVNNGRIECTFSGCRLACNSGYKLQGKRKIYLTCNQKTGQFMHNGQPWRQSAPDCVPNCRDGCQNGGTCIAPRQCQCSPGYRGTNCEVRECPEPSFPDAQASFTRTDDDELRVECHQGYVLPPGTAPGGVAPCRDGAWDLPDDFRCQPSCGRPGCQNGGRCVAPNQCQCEDQFTGEHCQLRRCEEPQVTAISANLTVNETHLTAECEAGYAFPHGGTVATLYCQDGEWHSEELVVADNSTLECTPQETPCYYPSKTFSNTIMEGDLFSHSLRCPRGFRMKDGREGVALVCLEAEWTVRGEGLMVDLDLNCYPV